MYGQGNYAPQFGQSPNRPPRPPFMQQQVSHGSALTSLIQQGPSVSPHGVAQPPHASSPVVSTYHSARMTQSCSSTSTPRTGQSYPPQATTAQYFSPLLPPSSHSRVPPPPPPQNQNIYRHPIHQPLPTLQQISVPHSAPPLPPSPQPFPPPPPPSSSTDQPSPPVSKTINSGHVQSDCDPCFSQAVTRESVQNIVKRDTKFTNRASDPNDASAEGGLSSIPIDKIDVPTPPLRPTNEKTLRNIEILCQYISQNGPAFEDMARQKESGNSAFRFLFGGEPGSEAATEREYYLWMKNKLCPGQNKSNILLKNKHEENSSSVEPNKEASYPVIDSDMDMEDDIIQPGVETDIHDQMSGLKHESVSSVDEIEKGDQNNFLESLHGGTSTTYKEPAIELGGNDGGRSNMTVCTKTQTEDPFKLLKDYSSDESSEFDASEPVSTLQLDEPIAVASDQCKTQDVDASLAHEISANELIPGPSSVESKSDIAVDNNVRADASKQSDFHDLEETDKDLRERTKSSASVKVDEFGRLIREGGSETDSDDSRHYRRRGRRGRSRSPSRSPPKRRRRSPRRRKERRSLSRSWSPKRRRSRSRSPLRRPIESGSQKSARGRHQTGECFNFLKGRCYRGASCKYLHSDPDKHGESRQYRSKHHASGTRTSSRDYDHSEENKVTTRKGSPDNGRNGKELQDDEVKDGDLMAKQKEHAGSVYAPKSSIVEEKDKAKDVSDLFNSNLQKAKDPSQAESLNQVSQISTVSSCMPSEAMVSPCKNSVELSGQKDLSAFNYPNHVSHLQQPLSLPLPPPPPPPPPSLHAATVPHIPQPIQHTQFHPPQNMSWGNFPPQRPPYILTPPLHSGPASFQQGSFPGNHLGQPVAGSLNSTSARDDPFSNTLSSGPFPSSSLGEANPNRGQYFAHGNLPSGEPSSSGFQNPPYLQQQPYGLYQAAGNNIRDPSHFSVDLHKNNPSQISDTGSRITAHHNPYASAFDQPLGSNFKSDVFRQGNKNEYENSYNLSGAPFEGQNVAYGASPVIPSPHSSKAGCQTLARSGEDQYDPLFDSIEPSAESMKKQVEQQDRAADNSDIMLRLSGSGKKKVLGADSAATSSETDEFGETAHPEVIAVEAGSQSNLNDSAEGSAGDVEINQVKSKKNRDSRSMKLFKLALASFVKDMLKPSWRQGNMSKEAFKTIVKKTVEKVSGAMKGHRVPKSKAKIDQYIDRSQRKLTALVEGYVNKYAK